jgi:hypothetical protein
VNAAPGHRRAKESDRTNYYSASYSTTTDYTGSTATTPVVTFF